MTGYDLRGALAEGRHILATSVLIPSPVVVETLAASDFEALCIDMEHTPLSVESTEALLRAADVHGAPVVVRVPELGPDISRVLDAGAAGVIVPRVESAEQAADAVRRARYAPLGARGAGPGRGSGYGADLLGQVASANDRVLLCVQIETRLGVERAAEILAVPGLDVVVIGPFDLALSLGTTVGSAEHTAAIDAVFEIADAAGVTRGAFSFTADDTARHLETGTRVLFVESDLGWLGAGLQETWARLSGLVPGSGRAAARTGGAR